MPKTNAEIAAFRDPNKTRAGWWQYTCPRCTSELGYYDGFLCPSKNCHLSLHTIDNPVERYTGPDFATDPIACFKELEPPLLAMGALILRSKAENRIAMTGLYAESFNTYSAAVTTAFSWAIGNQPEGLRRACEEVGRG